MAYYLFDAQEGVFIGEDFILRWFISSDQEGEIRKSFYVSTGHLSPRISLISLNNVSQYARPIFKTYFYLYYFFIFFLFS